MPPNKNAHGGNQRAANIKRLHDDIATNSYHTQVQLRRAGKALIGNCPCCGYKNALSVTEKDGKRLFYCHAGCAQGDLWAMVRDADGASNWQPVRHTEARPVDKGLDDYIRRLWQSSLPARGSAVDTYLNARRISNDIPTALRSLPRHLHKNTGIYYPVMLAAVTDYTGKLQALHRTYLAIDGKNKAPVEPSKMTLGAVGGYATHLAKAGEKLAVTEGIENGLSILQAKAIPTWAALSAGGIERLILPPYPAIKLQPPNEHRHKE